jgi:hypothetical protein
VYDKFSLAFRLMRENADPDFGSLKPTFFVCAAVLIFVSLATAEMLFAASMFLAAFGLPPAIAIFTADSVITVYYSQTQAWLKLTAITNQGIIWSYILHSLYCIRRMLLIGLLMSGGFLTLNRVLIGRQTILCPGVGDVWCGPDQIAQLLWSIMLTAALMIFLGGIYLLATSIGVYSALRYKTRESLAITGDVTLFANSLFVVMLYVWLSQTHWHFLIMIVCLMLPYLLALIVARLAKDWLWKPARRRL